MPINLGSGAISAAKIGSTDVAKIMLGSTEVYAAGGGGLPSIAGLEAWIDASDSTTITLSGSVVTAISDKALNSHDFTPSGGTGPTLSSGSQNSLDTITFPDAYKKLVTSTVIPVGSSSTTFLVASRDAASSNGYGRILSGSDTGDGYSPAILSGYGVTGSNDDFELYSGASGPYLSAGVNNTSGPKLLTLAHTDGGTVNLYYGGTLADTSSSAKTFGTKGWNEISGGSLSEGGTFTFCELVVYDSVLSTSDRQSVESYLTTKWGL